MKNGFDGVHGLCMFIRALICILCPMTKNTTCGNQSLDYVVTTTLASASRSFLLKKMWEEFRYHVASRWVFFWYRGDQQAGSSQHANLWPCDLPLLRSLCAPGAFVLSPGTVSLCGLRDEEAPVGVAERW